MSIWNMKMTAHEEDYERWLDMIEADHWANEMDKYKTRVFEAGYHSMIDFEDMWDRTMAYADAQ